MKRVFLLIFLLILLCSIANADRLPEGVLENQIFRTSSMIEASGVTTESTTAIWQTSDQGLDELPRPIGTQKSIRSGSIAYVTFRDMISTNGGQISEVKSFSMDTHAKTEGLYNIMTEKVLTYTSQNASHLMGEESYVLDVAGNWSQDTSDLVCVFSGSEREITPAFCNKVTASSKLRSITTAQIESTGSLTAVGKTPAALHYEIAVTPDTNSASGYADGIVSTTFTVSVMEGRSDETIKPEVFNNNWKVTPGEDSNTYVLFIGDNLYIRLRNPNLGPGNGFVARWDGGGVGGKFSQPGPLNKDITIPTNDNDYAGFRLTVVDDTTWKMTVNEDRFGLLPGEYIIDISDPNPETGITTLPVLEHSDELAATITASDIAMAAGGISQFVKAFTYQSGVACDRC